MSTDDGTPQGSTTGTLRRGALAVAGGTACLVALMLLPGGTPVVEASTALLGLVLLVAGTLWVGSSTGQRIV